MWAVTLIIAFPMGLGFTAHRCQKGWAKYFSVLMAALLFGLPLHLVVILIILTQLPSGLFVAGSNVDGVAIQLVSYFYTCYAPLGPG